MTLRNECQLSLYLINIGFFFVGISVTDLGFSKCRGFTDSVSAIGFEHFFTESQELNKKLVWLLVQLRGELGLFKVMSAGEHPEHDGTYSYLFFSSCTLNGWGSGKLCFKASYTGCMPGMGKMVDLAVA